MTEPKLARSVRRRLAAAFVGFAAACLGSGLLAAYLGEEVWHRGDLDRAIVEKASGLLAHHDAGGRDALTEKISKLSGEGGGDPWLYAYWSEETSTVWAGNMEPPADSAHTGELESYRVEDRFLRGVSYRLPGGDAVAVAQDITRKTLLQRRLLMAGVLAGAVGVVLSIGAGLWVSRNLVRRVEQMNHIVVSLLHGRRSERMHVRAKGDEFDSLARHFNELLDENEGLVSQVREVTNNIAHDLRTPLVRVRNHMEESLARPRSPELDAEAFAAALSETSNLLDTFQSLLSIARIESGVVQEELGPVDLSQVTADAVELFEPAAEDLGLALSLRATPGTVVRGNRDLLSQALTNLIDNALKFSSSPGTIDVLVRAGAEGPELVVADHGPGIPEAERKHVLQRFTRLDASRERPGTGLGLSLVAAVVALHGSRLRLTDNGPGLVATIAFPPMSDAHG